MILKPYFFLFYVLYKYIDLTSSEKLKQKHPVPGSACALLFWCLANNFMAFLFISNLLYRYILGNISFILFAIIFIIPLIIIYFTNKKLFLKSNNYKKIITYFDERTNLKKIHFILISGFYQVFSLSTMILSGILYSRMMEF